MLLLISRREAPRLWRSLPGLVMAPGWMLMALLALAGPARAQFPGGLAGTVTVDGGGPIGGVLIELPELGQQSLSDASGAFRFRGLEPGRYQILARQVGYVPWSGAVEIENGRVARVRVELIAVPVELDGLEVVHRAVPALGVRLGRDEIERSGARTAGELVRRAPGVVLREEGAGGQQTVSIRGSGPEAVLVLVDGVALNDPVSGVADLSTVAAATIESITVLVGAQGSRYGARAEAGVVLIETRVLGSGPEARASMGSLGEWGAAAEGGAMVAGVALTAGSHLRRGDGQFDYPRVPGVDETIVRRVNADLSEYGAYIGARAHLGAGEVRGRLGGETLERGVPGKGYAPSREARQEMGRLRGSVGWRHQRGTLSSRISLSVNSQRLHNLDPAPPFGLSYDDTTRATSVELRAEVERQGGREWLRLHGVGVEGGRQSVSSGTLSGRAPRRRTDLGVYAHSAVGTELGGWDTELAVELRADHDETQGRWYLNRSLSGHISLRGLALHLSNRSGYSPPTLGDQYFREGVGIAPNPDLQAERVPSEWEAGARVGGGGEVLGIEVRGAAGARFYQGDVRGMIIWLPDFSFVWSPRNVDINRRGLEVWAELEPFHGLFLSGSYSAAVATYDRPGWEGDVQVAYRPRHSAQFEARWEGSGWRVGAGTLYTGTRYPGPATINALDPFWTFRLDLGREWRAGPVDLSTNFQVDRLSDERDTLIFGFPEAGRRFRVEARVRPAPTGR